MLVEGFTILPPKKVETWIPMVSRFVQSNISKQETNMTLVHEQGILETGPMSIKRGIFQADSLSPLLFTMSLNPVSR